MINSDEVRSLLENGGDVVGDDGNKIGSAGQVFLDDETSRPEWVTVKAGMFGGSESFVPLADASMSGNDVHVPFDKEKVKNAPGISDSDGHLSPEEEEELYRYYGMDYSQARSDSDRSGHGDADGGVDRDSTTAGVGTGTGHTDRDHDHDHDRERDNDRDRDHDHDRDTVGHDTSGRESDDAMTRSEEQLRVDKERTTTGRARLRKYVVTENVTTTVPVSREEVRVEREPITEENRGEALSGGDLTDEEHEVELTEERVKVDKETVPVERVRMEKDTVTEDQHVDEEVRKEQIETEGTETGTTGDRDVADSDTGRDSGTRTDTGRDL